MTETYFYRVLLIPSAVFLSVVFGASYGSGREVMEFVTSNGPSAGLVSIGTLAITYSLLLSLSFELARMFRAYDYVSFFRVLLGRAWFLYEIVILVGMVIALSITTTVGGTVLGDHFLFSPWIGTLLVLVLIVTLNYAGRGVVERSMMVSVAALFIVLAILVVELISNYVPDIVSAFTAYGAEKNPVFHGLKYAISNGGYLPLLLYAAMQLNSRAEAFIAGLVAACVAVIPALVFHLAFMSGYPQIVDERLPTYWLFDHIMSPVMLNVYVLVMFVLVAQTGVGLLQGLIERMDVWHRKRTGNPLSNLGHGSIAAGASVISLALGSMGIIALILRGYTIMFYSFIIVYIIPLFTYGVYLVTTKRQTAGNA